MRGGGTAATLGYERVSLAMYPGMTTVASTLVIGPCEIDWHRNAFSQERLAMAMRMRGTALEAASC
jgi:hypothetical protein